MKCVSESVLCHRVIWGEEDVCHEGGLGLSRRVHHFRAKVKKRVWLQRTSPPHTYRRHQGRGVLKHDVLDKQKVE